jgi:hypothetical protein
VGGVELEEKGVFGRGPWGLERGQKRGRRARLHAPCVCWGTRNAASAANVGKTGWSDGGGETYLAAALVRSAGNTAGDDLPCGRLVAVLSDGVSEEGVLVGRPRTGCARARHGRRRVG